MNIIKISPNLWPHAIIMWFIMFAAAMAAWITFAVRQNMDLVHPDYYEHEIRFQQQLDRINRTGAIRTGLAFRYDPANGVATLHLPALHATNYPKGLVQFYRPSDASRDFSVPLAVDASGMQRIGVGTLLPGQWKLRAQWQVDGIEYFYEQILILTGVQNDSASVPVNRN